MSDIENGIIYELEPNTTNAVARAFRKASGYAEELKELLPSISWKIIADTYKENTMGVNRFRNIFGSMAVKNGWLAVKGGWVHGIKETDECIVSIDLQKSSYGKQFYVNIKIYVQGAFGRRFDGDLNLQNSIPTAFRRLPGDFDDIFDLTSVLNDNERLARMSSVFRFLEDFAREATSLRGLLKLAENGKILLIVGVPEEIQRLLNT